MIGLAIVLLVFVQTYSIESRDVSLIALSQLTAEELNEVKEKSSRDVLLRMLSDADNDNRMRALNNEVVAMITGHDFYQLNADEKVNTENHIIVDAAVLMSRKLSTSQKAYDIVRNASETTRQTATSSTNLSAVVSELCDRIDVALKNDALLNADYTKTKAEVRRRRSSSGPSKVLYYDIPKTTAEAVQIRSDLLNTIEYRWWVWNKLFLADFLVSYSIANAVLALAQHPQKATIVQEFYDDAVFGYLNTIRELKEINEYQTAEKFKAVLMEKFKRDPEMHDDLKQLINKYRQT